ncbi:hypothetical protein [Acanthopleuribacter pedis]|uniref:Uncharacterized protein n=1 Tax=Acanthopleuribacter pedis TaxID=442870 RepID=A0A8J7QFW1_9BACT|nr:hypothetical protein [Acanthopleuribacter pedis]MBO1319721.1 hypothetical protein [Acanthopleuribacter pedis]
MTVTYLKPRQWNQSLQVSLFMKLWDQPLTEDQAATLKAKAPMSQKRSAFGNLNIEGTPFPSQSCLASRFHPDFVSVLEPGVIELVEAVGVHHNLITYTSCEGHHYHHPETANDERHVGILSRDKAEHAAVLRLFEAAAAFINRTGNNTPVEGALMDHGVSDGDRVYPAADLYLVKRDGFSWAAYFDAVDAVCAALCGYLFDQEPIA